MIETVVLVWFLGAAAAEPVPWWTSAAYYRIDVDSFKDTDGYGLGDLPDKVCRQMSVGTTKQLSYVKALGADAVIFSSVSEKSRDCAKPGIMDFAEIDLRYGNVNNFNELIQKATKLDGVVMGPPVKYTYSNKKESSKLLVHTVKSSEVTKLAELPITRDVFVLWKFVIRKKGE